VPSSNPIGHLWPWPIPSCSDTHMGYKSRGIADGVKSGIAYGVQVAGLGDGQGVADEESVAVPGQAHGHLTSRKGGMDQDEALLR
jgi:hypothetical protein